MISGSSPTHGKHALFTDHAATIRDIRRQALHVGGYAVRYTYSEREKRWRVFVRSDRETYGRRGCGRFQKIFLL